MVLIGALKSGVDIFCIFARMKLFAIIFAMLTLTLSAIPCVDGSEEHTVESPDFSQNNHDHQHGGFDVCSPFCTCVCCSTVILKSFPNTFELAFPQIVHAKKSSPYYISNFPQGNKPSLFQPPKV